jgi:very-short-patch-repair endonuclease
VPRTDERLLERAKAMRSEMTQPERELWIALRAKRHDDVKFSRQVVIGPFITDFAARSRKLIVELDGDTHTDHRRDASRTEVLEQQGYRVIRFDNTAVMQNLEGVLTLIDAALATAPLPTLSPEGRGL